MSADTPDFYTLVEFAQKLRVHPNTVRRAILAGRISALKVGSGKRSVYRIPHSEISRIMLFDVEQFINEKIEERLRGRSPL